MVNRLSLVQKLVAMVLLPTIGLVLFAYFDMSRKRKVSAEMQELVSLARLSVATSDLIDGLERERGIVAGMLAEGGSRDLSQFNVESERTDQLISGFLETLGAMRSEGANGPLAGLKDSASKAIEALRTMRADIASQRISAINAVPAYSDLTTTILPTIAVASKATTDARIKSMLVSVDYLVHLRMYAGLERAGLNMACTLGRMDPGILQALVELIARQTTYQDLFLAHATAEHASLLRTALESPAVEEVNNLRSQAAEALGGEKIGISPGQWWRASTARIELLSATGGAVTRSVISSVEDMQREAARDALISGVMTVVSVLAAVLFSIVVARSLGKPLIDASTTTHKAASQILSAVQQLTASITETATAISQTSTTVDEIRQTSGVAASKAQVTSKTANESKIASDQALEAVGQGEQAMQTIREGVEAIAATIVELSEKTVRIGEIVETVKEIAEQSNLLAVNASIEAAKAGEHGRGFSVVASEVKSLARRSKEATDEIRSILSEIERSSNRAVMITEQGVKRVEEGGGLIRELGQAIENLARVIEENADVASQISLTAGQQLAGIEQINEALRSVEAAANDNAAGAQQLSKTAEEIQVVRVRITEIVRGLRASEA